MNILKLTDSKAAEVVRALYDYDPYTGIFTHKEKPRRLYSSERSYSVALSKCVVGGEVGSVDANGYVCICVLGKKLKAHRLAWLWFYGSWPKKHIDHINRVRTDNRIKNLRDVSRTKNNRNVSISNKNTSGVKGVSWHKANCNWRAVIHKNGKQISLGNFNNFNDAVRARREGEVKYGY